MMLCFHTFEEKSNYPFNFTLFEFINIIQQLKSRNISFQISIDDAHKTTMRAVDSILTLGIKPLIGVPAGQIQKQNKLTWSDITSLFNLGCEIASHGYNHIELKEENEQLFKEEIEISKKILEQKISHSVDSFIYPRGAFCSKAISTVKNNYKRAYSILHSSTDLYLLPRYMLTRYNYKKFLMEL